jgi:uncharacterized protein
MILEIATIPQEGLEIDERLSTEGVHLAADEEFALREACDLRCHVDRGDDESVHVRGRLNAALELQCGRCLDAFPLAVDQELDLFYLPRPAEADGVEDEEEVALSDRDLVVSFYSGEALDLGEMVREQLYLALPLSRLCRKDCRGLCSVCGKNRNDTTCSCEPEEDIDPRLSPLKELLKAKG